MKTLIKEFLSLSIRKMASAVQVSTKTVFNILNDDLHLKPYKLQDRHKLEVHDYVKRVEFATWCLSIGHISQLDLKKCLICSDETYFYLTFSPNKQNNRNWSDSRPLEGIERPLHDEKILVWCEISTKIFLDRTILKKA